MVGLVAAALLVPALTSVAAPPDRSSRDGEPVPEFVPGELLVRFESGTSVSTRRSFRARNALKRLEGLPVPGLERLKVSASESIPALAERLARHPAVRFAEPNYIVRALDVVPNDLDQRLWGLHNEGQVVNGVAGKSDADIDAPEGWDLGLDTDQASNVVVAVIDTGVDIHHPDLEDQIWQNTPEKNGEPGEDDDKNGFIDDVHGWDFSRSTSTFPGDPTVFDPSDLDDHGTHVAGTIAATMGNGLDVAGVSQAQIMPVKFLGEGGSGSTANAVKAIDYAVLMGADVTSNSWGGGGFSQSLRNAIERANAAGQLFVAAAGNDGKNADASPHYPSGNTNPNIISVAATDNRDERASFSNYGATSVDLGAPGQSVLSTVPSFGKAVLAGPELQDGPAYRSALHTFGIEGIPSQAERRALLGAALEWMALAPTDPILIVDDDRGRSFQTAYQQALGALGYANHTTVSTGNKCSTGPTAGTMAEYSVVIWFTGSEYECTLRSTDRSRITTYLGGGAGRNLLLFGQDIGYDLTGDGAVASPFLEETMRVDYLADFDENFNLSGVPGTPYGGVGAVTLDGREVGAGQFFSSAISPKSGAVMGLRGGGTALFSGTSMATPHVTGAAAQVMARFPSMTHLQVKDRLLRTGDPLPSLAGITVSGRRLNLAAALDGPTGLVATARPGGIIDLVWDPATDPAVTAYRVYRGTSSGFAPSPATFLDEVTVSSYQDVDGEDGSTYFYVVRAVRPGGESGDSNEASARADAMAPTVTAVDPGDAATDVPIDQEIVATFSEPMAASTVSESTFRLSRDGVGVPASVEYDENTMVATLVPDDHLTHDAQYSVEVTTGATDLVGNALEPMTWSFHSAGDETPPEVGDFSHQGGQPLSVIGPLELSGMVTDDVGVASVDVAIERPVGAHWDGTRFRAGGPIWFTAGLEAQGTGAEAAWSFVWDPVPSADWEVFVVRIRVRDTAGNLTEGSLEITLDNVAPTQVVTDAGTRYQRDRTFPVAWEAVDGSTGDSNLAFDLERRVARFDGGWGPWKPWDAAQGTEETEAEYTGTPGRTYCFRATATDQAGNAATGPQACTAVPVNDTVPRHRGAWTERSGQADHYLETFSRSSQRRARLVLEDVRARRLAIVATRCPSCGKIAVRWRGRTIRTINLAAGDRQPAKVIGIKTFRSVQTGTLVVKVVSSGKAVIVEGLGVSRA